MVVSLSSIRIIEQAHNFAYTTNHLNSNTVAELTVLVSIRNGDQGTTLKKWRNALNNNNYKVEVDKLKSKKITDLKTSTNTLNNLHAVGIFNVWEIITQSRMYTRKELITKTTILIKKQVWKELKNKICIPGTILLTKAITDSFNTEPDFELKMDMTKVEHEVTLTAEGDILIFTDGSSAKDRFNVPASGVFFAKDSPLNLSFLTTGRINISFIGELATIEMALLTAPGWAPIHIITDSKAAIDAILAFKNKRWSKRKFTEGRDYIKRIRRLLRLRNKQHQQVQFKHIYSHLKKKKRIARKQGTNEYNLLKGKISEMKDSYGALFDVFIYGNEEADKLASQAYKAPQPMAREFGQGKERKMDKAIVRNNEGHILSTNLSKVYCEKEKDLQESKLSNYPQRGIIRRYEEQKKTKYNLVPQTKPQTCYHPTISLQSPTQIPKNKRPDVPQTPYKNYSGLPPPPPPPCGKGVPNTNLFHSGTRDLPRPELQKLQYPQRKCRPHL